MNPHESKPRVFVIERYMPYDIRSVAEYGEPTYLTDGGLSPFAPSDVAKQVIASLEKQAFNPDRDFICMTGPSNIVAFMFAAVACEWESFNVLVFNARGHKYQVRRWADPAATQELQEPYRA